MRPEMEALGHRAIACRRWFWMPGMLTSTGIRLTFHQRPGYVRGEVDIPDLTDPATLGCLLQLVNEAWPGVVIRYELGYARYNGLEHYTNEEAPRTFLVLRSPESLVAALEAAR